jgi:hypothetical protein
MPYFPVIASANPRRRYLFGEYQALLLDEVRSAQTIQYYFILIVFRGQDEVPCLAVASEYSAAESDAAPFLGVFPGDGHLNLGNSPDWLVLDKFAAEAVRVALNHLGLPENQRIVVEEARKKPWWKRR